MALNVNYNLDKKALEEIKNKNSLHVRYKIKKDLSNPIVKPNKLLLIFFCISLILVILLHSFSVKSEIYLSKLQKDIVRITESNYSLNVQLENEKRLEKIEKLAKENLNMRQITNSEITYLKKRKINYYEKGSNIFFKNHKIIDVPLGY